MAKKKRVPTSQMRRILVRVPDDLAEWIDDTAAELRLSRDAFLRTQLEAMREGFKLAAVEGTEEALLFRRFEDRIQTATERAVREAVSDAIKASGGVTRASTGRKPK